MVVGVMVEAVMETAVVAMGAALMEEEPQAEAMEVEDKVAGCLEVHWVGLMGAPQVVCTVAHSVGPLEALKEAVALAVVMLAAVAMEVEAEAVVTAEMVEAAEVVGVLVVALLVEEVMLVEHQAAAQVGAAVAEVAAAVVTMVVGVVVAHVEEARAVGMEECVVD